MGAAGAGFRGQVIKAALLTAAVVATWWLQQHLLALSEWSIAASFAGVVIAAIVCANPTGGLPEPSRWSFVAALLALTAAIFCRLQYLWSVPSGYNYEPLAFLFFARKLINEGFPYIPYAWYAHTLYSYWTALWLLLISSDVVAYRVANAAMGILTVVVLYATALRLFGRRVAWIAIAMLSASWWHLWASRNGYHQQLMPLIQALYLYGVVVGFTASPRRGFAVAAIAMVLALHAYWGLYLLLPLSLCIALYVVILHRDQWRRSWRTLSCAVALAVLSLIPLARFLVSELQIFSYVQKAVVLPTANTGSVEEKRLDNASYVFWALSGNPHAKATFGSVVDPLVACAAVIGLGIALRRSRQSLAHAAVVLLLAVNVVGLTITIANYFYVTSLLASVYLLAAIGISGVMESWEAWWPALAAPLGLATVALLAFQGVRNYDAFFFQHAVTDLRSPAEPMGRSFLLLDDIERLVGNHAVFLPQEEPGRDFDSQIFALGERIPSYEFMRQTLAYDATRLLFPEALVGDRPVVIFLPNESFVSMRLLPLLRQLYPAVKVTEIVSPEPYRRTVPGTMAYRIDISVDDLRARRGLVTSPGNPATRVGFIATPQEGWYRFRRASGTDPEVLLHGKNAILEERSYLEGGVHPIEIRGWPAGDRCPIEWQVNDGPWQSANDALVNAQGLDWDTMQPYVAHVGRWADFYYSRLVNRDHSVTLRDALVAPDGALTLLKVEEVDTTDEHQTPRTVATLPGVHAGWLASPQDATQVIDPDGNIYRFVDGKFDAPKTGPCAPITVASDETGIVFLCPGALLWDPSSPHDKLQLSGRNGQPLLVPSRLARRGDAMAVVDAQASEVLRYNRKGELQSSRVLPRLWPGSDLTFDPEGNLYVKHRRWGVRTYAPDGSLLLHPITGHPMLLTQGELSEIDTITPGQLKFSGDRGIAITPEGQYQLFERRRVDVPGR